MTLARQGGLAWSVKCLALAFLASFAVLVSPAMAMAASSANPFEIVPGSFHFTTSGQEAGAHADWVTTFDFAHENRSPYRTFNDVANIAVNLPPGFTGNDRALPTCTERQLIGTSIESPTNCPPASQVGTIALAITLEAKYGPVRDTFPLYNMKVTSAGVVAELAFKAIALTSYLVVSVRPGDSGLTITSPNIQKFSEPRNITVTTWGLPASKSHDAERGLECYSLQTQTEGFACVHGGESANVPVVPYLTNPTSCAAETATMKSDSWEELGNWSEESTEVPAMSDCSRVPFSPGIAVEPTTDAAESSSGLNVSLEVPQRWEEPFSLSVANLKEAKVTLPRGYTVNPSAGSGLAGCTPAQYEAETYFSLPGAECPFESKLGTVVIDTPVFDEKINGDLYLAEPYDNPFGEPGHPNGSLLALYLIAKVPDRGIIVKSAGKVEADPVTGQLTSTFDNIVQQPFSRVTVKFRQGATSPLVSPPACGRYTAHAELTPWSAPTEPRLVSNTLEIEHGIGGGPCPPGGVPPFSPTVVSGTQNNDAGNYTPFYLRIVRNDGEQELTKFTTILPPGLTANLTGIPFCSDAEIEVARHRTGQQEIHEPACPAASEIGHTLVGAGVGTVLAWTPGKVYLAGPYHGSALSIVSITSATVGPFDLGTVVIRFALRINPVTGQAEIDGTGSDPIPHIIEGIVVHVRDIHVYVDRSKFMIDPTSCKHLSISNTITGAGADPASTGDDQTVSVTTPFQAADCSSLGFKPLFKASTSGKTSRAAGASLSVKLTYPNAPLGTQANIHSVKVDLPKQLPSRLTTLQKACVDSVFNANPAACPAASRVGIAKAITPILPVPIEGPAYFVSHGGAKFPELIVVLQGYGVTIDLHGETFINKEGITSSTFRSVPDEPVTSFELTLPQGPGSALAANGNLCGLTKTVLVKRRVTVRVKGHRKTVTRQLRTTLPASLIMPTAFTAQNGTVIKQNTPITVTGCGKAKQAKASGRGKRHAKGK